MKDASLHVILMTHAVSRLAHRLEALEALLHLVAPVVAVVLGVDHPLRETLSTFTPESTSTTCMILGILHRQK